MLNFIYKHSIFVIILSLIINFNLVSHSQTTDNNIYKIQTNFTQELSVKTDISNNLVEEKKEIFNTNQFLIGLFSSSLMLLSVTVVFIFIGLIAPSFRGIPFLTFPFINSFMVYELGENRENASYLLTLLGSVVGFITFILLSNLIVFIESNSEPKLDSSIIARNQWFFNIIFIPIFSTIGATIFYHLSLKEQKESDIKDLEKKVLKDYKEIVSKININNGKLSYSLVQF